MAETPDPYSVSLEDFTREVQPDVVVSRRSGEHWLGLLYARKLSPRISRRLIHAGVSAMTTTYVMVLIGLTGAVAIAIPGVWSALFAALAMQTYLVLDCSDGEIARWTHTQGAKGVYVDRLGHYVTEATAFVALGFRAQGEFDIGVWAYAGALTAVFVLMTKAESDLVVAARATAGLSTRKDTEPTTDKRLGGVRAIVHRTRIHRMLGAIEMSLLVLITALIDMVAGGLTATRVLLGVSLVVGALLVLAHFVSVVASDRLSNDQ